MFTREEQRFAKEALDKCVEKYGWVSKKIADGIPYTTGPDGSYDNKAVITAPGDDNSINWWTNGFWGGVLWHLYAITGDNRYADMANNSEALLDRCFNEFYGLHHDVGFMWLPTSVANYRFTGNPESRKRALHAANLLAGRFNLAGRFIRAWNDWSNTDTRGWAIIDCLMNLPLLHWASGESNDPRFSHIAIAHADTVLQRFLRPDGSVCHIAEFDPVTGVFVKSHRGQGFAEGSAWARGQGWALYGFTVNYNCTGKADYLQAACRVADFFVNRIPDSGFIPIDFGQPAEPVYEDSCAAAIGVCGLLELAMAVTGADRDRYKNAAITILTALDRERADYGPACDAILQRCSGGYHYAGSRHITMIYADYFYIEALTKINGKRKEFFW